MVDYVMLFKYKPAGIKAVHENAGALQKLEESMQRWEIKILENFHLLGEYDQCMIISAPDNFKAYRGVLEQELSSTADTQILPAIDMPLFKKLCERNFHIEGPHKWQIRWWARAARYLMRYETTNKYIGKYCIPRTIVGRHNFENVKQCIVIANHTSMADGMLVQYGLPNRIRLNIYSGAAADRWFVKRTDRKEMMLKPWYQSLVVGSFPIQRGGGSRALEYSHWLLEQGANLLIFPEGTRSTSRSMARFKNGVAILALEHNVPVVPCYITGMNKIRPKGTSEMTPGPATATYLEPIYFEPGTDVPTATHIMHEKLNAVHHAVLEDGPEAAAAFSKPERG